MDGFSFMDSATPAHIVLHILFPVPWYRITQSTSVLNHLLALGVPS